MEKTAILSIILLLITRNHWRYQTFREPAWSTDDLPAGVQIPEDIYLYPSPAQVTVNGLSGFSSSTHRSHHQMRTGQDIPAGKDPLTVGHTRPIGME